MILFKPWRSSTDLRELAGTWESTFEKFIEKMCSRHRKVLDNMQVSHECRDSRNDHMQTRVRQKAIRNADLASDSAAMGNDIENIDMTEVLDHLEDIDRMSSRRQDETSRETQDCLDKLTQSGFFASFHGVPRSVPDGGSNAGEGVICVEDDTVEDEWRDTYEKRKLAWKREARHEETDSIIVAATINCADNIERMDQDPPVLMCNTIDGDMDGILSGRVDMVDQTSVKWTLNREQERAFKIVAQHTMVERPEQLLMYLGGPGGTGKSRVVSALRDFFEMRKEQRRFRLAAYTGVAARNIGGGVETQQCGWLGGEGS